MNDQRDFEHEGIPRPEATASESNAKDREQADELRRIADEANRAQHVEVKSPEGGALIATAPDTLVQPEESDSPEAQTEGANLRKFAVQINRELLESRQFRTLITMSGNLPNNPEAAVLISAVQNLEIGVEGVLRVDQIQDQLEQTAVAKESLAQTAKAEANRINDALLQLQATFQRLILQPELQAPARQMERKVVEIIEHGRTLGVS
jgi:hypothetical protein